MEHVSFIKFQGLGNDFILIDNTHQEVPLCNPSQARTLCDRNFGVGADGVIFALPGKNGCDYTMLIYNSDGSIPQMCGNGIRCLAVFLKGLESSKLANQTSLVSNTSYRIWTGAGIIETNLRSDGQVTVNMGSPILSPPENIPTTLAITNNNMVLDSPIEVNGIIFHSTAVSMGNPHSIIFTEKLESLNPPFQVLGPLLERHKAFPERVNAEFVEIISRTHLKMKVWERGAGPTLACGTGACAVVVAGVLTNRCERDCLVSLPGGDLQINWSTDSNIIYMTGPAIEVFRGQININSLTSLERS